MTERLSSSTQIFIATDRAIGHGISRARNVSPIPAINKEHTENHVQVKTEGDSRWQSVNKCGGLH